MQTESPEWLRNEAARLEARARDLMCSKAEYDGRATMALMSEADTLRKRAAYIENQQK